MKEQVLNYFGAKIVDEWSEECDFYIYEETTVDGYSIYVATPDPLNIIVGENIYYYDSDLVEALGDAFRYGQCKNIYIDEQESFWFEDAMLKISSWIDKQTITVAELYSLDDTPTTVHPLPKIISSTTYDTTGKQISHIQYSKNNKDE